MPEDRTPGFEQPDVGRLRSQLKGPSIWSRIGEGFVSMVTSRTTWTVILALLIIGTLVVGYQVLVNTG